jgi:hypothetical protein
MLENCGAIEFLTLSLHNFARFHVSCVPTAREVVIIDDGIRNKNIRTSLHCLGVAFVEEVVESRDETVSF